MKLNTIPTSKDIYIEINGKRAFIVESYKVKSQRKLIDIKEYNKISPVATLLKNEQYQLELKSLYLINNEKLDFYSLSDFTVTIVKPDCKILYSNCEWESISEFNDINSPCIEAITIIAKKRSVL